MATKVTESTDAKIKPRKEKPKPPATARPAPARDTVITRISRYLREVQTELKKTNWPGRPELIASTQVVLGLIAVVGVYIFLVDVSLYWLFKVLHLGASSH